MSVEFEKGLKAKTSDNRGRVSSKINFEELGEGIVGAKVEVSQINALEKEFALNISGEMGKAPHFCGASQPENPVAGEPHFWILSGRLWGEPTAICNQYALPVGKRARRTPRCLLSIFQIGRPLIWLV